ncbi:MAG TPA: carboxypeptidase-like regulatory domain-containing protein [Pyrinomonadaceae bacterium]
MKSRHFSTLLAVFALTIALAGRAEAFCPFSDYAPPCQAYWSAQAVFVGTVKEEVYSDIYQRGEGDLRWNYRRRITRFSVETAYKGVKGKLAEVVNEEIMPTPVVLPNGEQEMRAVGGYTDCDYSFNVGETYFIYANFGEENDGTLTVSRNRTGKLEDAAADLKYVNELPRAAPTARIFGRIVRTDLSVGKDKGGLLPLAGIKVTARSGNRTFEALTDARGKYELKDLPPGNYRVTPAYPAHLSADDGSARVSARGCAQLDFHTQSNVRLKGRVLDAQGRPLPSLEVNLIAADGAETTSKGNYTFTNQEGDYVLTGIPTGRYLLFFSLSRNLGEHTSRPRTYYPGVWSEAQATVITVVEGENLPAYDLQLLPTPADRAVEIVVTWPDGRPVGDAFLYLEDFDYEWDASPPRVKKVDGQEGHYQVTGFDGLTYWARAHANNFEGMQMHAEPVKFTLTEGAGPIKLVITSPGGHCPHYRRK